MVTTLQLPEYLHAVHDGDGAGLMDGYPGWVVITEAIGHDPNNRGRRDYGEYKRRGLGVVVRINNAHDGVNGTIPEPRHYRDFAQCCANFVAASKGIDVVIIGNEPNHSNEWPCVDGKKVPIDPSDYARCYGECRMAVRGVRNDLPVLLAAIAPWNNESGDWLQYLRRVVNQLWQGCDGFALHAYTHGSDPALIFSDEMQHGWYWHFRVYRQQMVAIREIVKGAAPNMFFFITETNQGDSPWLDADNGWVQNAHREIDDWNQLQPLMIIRGLALYRSNRDDRWSFADKEGVKRDFRKAVERGYKAPPFSPPVSTPQGNSPQQEALRLPSVKAPSASPSLPPREIDPRAAKRSTAIQTPMVQPGQQFWYVSRLYTPNEAESDALGPDRNILTNVLVNGARQVGVPLLVTWGNGGPEERATIYTKNNPGFAFSGDHLLTPGDFTLEVADGKPSERVVNIKMGEFDAEGRWNPGAHTSALVDWELVTMPGASAPTPATPVPIATRYVIEPDGANLRAAPVDGKVLIAVPFGESIQVLDTNSPDDWLPVRYGEHEGYMFAALTGVTPPAQPRPEIKLFHPLGAGPKPISQYFLENPTFYKRFIYDGVPLEGHNGIDFGVVAGSAVFAADAGKVTKAANDPEGWGLHVDLTHPWGETIYAHLRHYLVKAGDVVRAGDLIGYSGNTGLSTGPHLHFGMRIYPYQRNDGRGGYSDPFPYLQNAMTILPATSTPADDNWQRSLAWLLDEEGEFQDHDWDDGNWTGGKQGIGEKKGTKYGISAAAYPYLTIRDLTPAQAGELFYRDYWLPSGADKLAWPLCLLILDTAVLHGAGTATNWVEEIGLNPWLFAHKRLTTYTASEKWSLAGAGWVNRTARLLKAMATR